MAASDSLSQQRRAEIKNYLPELSQIMALPLQIAKVKLWCESAGAFVQFPSAFLGKAGRKRKWQTSTMLY